MFLPQWLLYGVIYALGPSPSQQEVSIIQAFQLLQGAYKHFNLAYPSIGHSQVCQASCVKVFFIVRVHAATRTGAVLERIP